MPDPQHVRDLYDRYPKLVTAGDVETICGLYADSATIEDPIGTPLHEGKAAVRAFYENAVKSGVEMKRTGPVRVVSDGSEAATPLIVKIGPPGQQQVIDIISVMTFDDAGKITSMRAYWSPDAIRPATPGD